MPKLAVIADDLTGANDTGVQFSKFGLKTMVYFDSSEPAFVSEDADVVVFDTNSRAEPENIAAGKVKNVCVAVGKSGVNALYKKIDSTLRGNVAAEISAACDMFKPVLTVIAPAFPKTRRTTVGGYQLLDGIPISMTEMSRDPKTPVKEAYLPRLLADDTGRSIGTIPLHLVLNGVSAITEAVESMLQSGVNWIVFDAASDENLRHIAEATASYGRILWVGTAGLAEHLPSVCGWNQESGAPKLEVQGEALVVAGSISQVTQNQIKTYVEQTECGHIVLDAVEAIEAPAQEVAKIIAAAQAFRQAGKAPVISCLNHREVIEAAALAGKRNGVPANEVGTRIASVLGLIVASLVKRGVGVLFLTGGETAISICRALGATGMEVCRELVPGIPLGKLVGGPFQGLPVITKAGAFGDTEAILKAIKTARG